MCEYMCEVRRHMIREGARKEGGELGGGWIGSTITTG